ncbi:MAG: class I SAM-dependent methyltransferase [Chloroflexi bacterium]|nr:class I SAM-dependent methyltransferase [Chloroflexota bacterium]
MWKAYFPQAQIYGLDIEDKSALAEDRITILRGDQGDPAFLEDLATRHGPFDVIIDDGSHRCEHVTTSFKALFLHLRDGGVYAIEDLQTSYWERYGGSSEPNHANASMTFLQRLTDGINHAESDIPDYEPSYADRWVRSISF